MVDRKWPTEKGRHCRRDRMVDRKCPTSNERRQMGDWKWPRQNGRKKMADRKWTTKWVTGRGREKTADKLADSTRRTQESRSKQTRSSERHTCLFDGFSWSSLSAYLPFCLRPGGGGPLTKWEASGRFLFFWLCRRRRPHFIEYK